MTPQTITLTQPDDWHVHLRDGVWLPLTVLHSARYFGRALIMPNLDPPLTTLPKVAAYMKRILAHKPKGAHFQPLMTLYLTEGMKPDLIKEARMRGGIYGVKLYPAFATTHSTKGVANIKAVYSVLETMQEVGLPLLVHGELSDSTVDVFDREACFIERVFIPLLKDFPELKVVFEHISTKVAVDFVKSERERLRATLTAHHLLYTRSDCLAHEFNPHLYCAPILKRASDRRALIEAATSGNPKFFLGTDSAPHARRQKESGCTKPGIYTAHIALELYAEVFEAAGKLERLEAFASFHGADFYGLPRNRQKIILSQQSWKVPLQYRIGNETLVPLRGGTSVRWKCRILFQ
ncbi:MAG: dihydroorotase [Gammaproteobacteria bacterium]|nr:dihydroorotase [Gammaproteobacteria bacterium]